MKLSDFTEEQALFIVNDLKAKVPYAQILEFFTDAFPAFKPENMDNSVYEARMLSRIHYYRSSSKYADEIKESLESKAMVIPETSLTDAGWRELQLDLILKQRRDLLKDLRAKTIEVEEFRAIGEHLAKSFTLIDNYGRKQGSKGPSAVSNRPGPGAFDRKNK